MALHRFGDRAQSFAPAPSAVSVRTPHSSRPKTANIFRRVRRTQTGPGATARREVVPVHVGLRVPGVRVCAAQRRLPETTSPPRSAAARRRGYRVGGRHARRDRRSVPSKSSRSGCGRSAGCRASAERCPLLGVGTDDQGDPVSAPASNASRGWSGSTAPSATGANGRTPGTSSAPRALSVAAVPDECFGATPSSVVGRPPVTRPASPGLPRPQPCHFGAVGCCGRRALRDRAGEQAPAAGVHIRVTTASATRRLAEQCHVRTGSPPKAAMFRAPISEAIWSTQAEIDVESVSGVENSRKSR